MGSVSIINMGSVSIINMGSVSIIHMGSVSIINNQPPLHPQEKYFTVFQKLIRHVQVKRVRSAILAAF